MILAIARGNLVKILLTSFFVLLFLSQGFGCAYDAEPLEVNEESIGETVMEIEKEDYSEVENKEEDYTVTPYIIFIDPGHQERGNYNHEPVGPGSSETKPRVTTGTKGVATGRYEFDLVLEVSKKLKTKLESNGFKVVMARETNDVDISNKERAILANEVDADVFLRIHADSSADSAVNGISILHPGLDNQFMKDDILAKSHTLAKIVLEEMIQSTGAGNRGLIARNDITGFNWAEVSVILIELGFMSNPEEDRKMSEPSYQEKLINGIYSGVEKFLKEHN